MISKYRKPLAIDLLPIDYELVDYDKNIFKLKHNVCGKEFAIVGYNLNNRIKNNKTICSHCNPYHYDIRKSKLSEAYTLIKIDYPTYNFNHDTCKKDFSISNTVVKIRLRNGTELCTNCNPLKKIGKIVLPDEYGLVNKTPNKIEFKHIKCGNTSFVHHGMISYRIEHGAEICFHCNPPIEYIPIKNQLTESYQLLNRVDDVCHIKHNICNKESKIHRRTLTFRIKSNIEPCLHCVPFQRQYSEQENEVVDFVKSIYSGKLLAGEERYRDGLYTLDCYLPDLKLAIEYNGDYFHANPLQFVAEDKIKNKTAAHIWKKDKRKLNHFKQQGINIMLVWENDWMNNKNMVKESVVRFLNP